MVYSFCISARGRENQYSGYRLEDVGTPYFVFNDNKTSERNPDGTFVDPEHLLIVFIFDRGGGRYPDIV